MRLEGERREEVRMVTLLFAAVFDDFDFSVFHRTGRRYRSAASSLELKRRWRGPFAFGV